jgi:hypothetical protein
MSEIKTCDNERSKNLHSNRVQQALTDPANSRDLAYGKAAHKVPDRLGIMRQMKLPVRLILIQKMNLYQGSGDAG